MVSKGFPNVVTLRSTIYYGEKPTFIMYTYYIIDRHAGIPKPRNTVSLGVQYIWTKDSGLYSNLVKEKVNFNLIDVSIGKVHCCYFDEGDLNRSLESDIKLWKATQGKLT